MLDNRGVRFICDKKRRIRIIWWECAFSSFVAIDTNAEMFKQRFFLRVNSR